MIDQNIQDLIDQIEKVIGGYEEGLNVDLANYVAQLKVHMLGGDFKNRTWDLRRSMKAAVIDDYAIQISMVYYGYFLAFGVNIRNQTSKRTLPVPSEVAGALSVSNRGRKIATDGRWRFGQASRADRVFGIDYRGTSTPAPGSSADSFYPDNVIQKLEEILLKYNNSENA